MLTVPIVDTPEPTPRSGRAVGRELRSIDVTTDHYKTDVTSLTERIAIRLAGDGAEHPVAAAITIAMRGVTRLGPNEYAETLGLALADVRALEAGAVPLADLPHPVWRLVHQHGLEPVVLVDLERHLRGGV